MGGLHHVGCAGCTDLFEADDCPLVSMGPAGTPQHRVISRAPARLTRAGLVASLATDVNPPTHAGPPAGPADGLRPDGPSLARSAKSAARRVPPAVLAFGVVSMLTDLSTEAVNAVLPLYVTAVLGLGPLAYGFVDGLYQGASAAVRILGGWWSDTSRRPKWVAFVGYAVSAVSKVALLFATGFAAIASIVTLDRLGKGLRTGPRDALIATASAQGQFGRDFGVHRALDTVGASLGPLVAFAVLAAIPWGGGGYRTIFVISAAFAVLGLVVLATTVPDLRGVPRKIKKWGRWQDLRTPAMVRLYVVAGLLGCATIGDGFVYLTLAQGDALAAQFFPLLFVGTNAAFLAFSVPLGKLADRIGRATVFIAGHIALLGMYLLLLSGNQSVPWIIGVLLLSGLFYAATDGVLAALTAQVVGEQSRASGISATQTVVAVARFGASVGFGLLWQVYGSTTAVIVMAVLLLVAVLGSFALLKPWLRPAAV